MAKRITAEDAALSLALEVQKSDWEYRWECYQRTGVPVMEQVVMERGLTHDQADALDWVMRWLSECADEQERNPAAPIQVMRLFGYAGTGKTTVAGALAATLPPGSVRFCAFVGQAVDVLRGKGCLPANTIHSLIYTPRIDDETDEVLGFDKRAANTYRDEGLLLIVVDEGSMVDDELFADLKIVAGVCILVLGDDYQLPPVNGKASLMEGCDLKLREVLRNAKGSPVIQLATHVRKYGCLPDVVGYMDDEHKCRITPKSLTDSLRNGSYLEDWQIICGTNLTRQHLNRVVRKELGYRGVCPMIGERIVITKNDIDIGVFNGQQYRVKDVLLYDEENRYAFIHVVKYGAGERFTRNLLIDLKVLDRGRSGQGRS